MQLLSMAYLINEVAADGVGPDITDVYHVPRYPLLGDEVTVYAKVTDQDGVKQVKLTYCGDGLCHLPITMTDPDSDDIFSAVIPWNDDWENGTEMYYEIDAQDDLNNNNKTDKSYYLIVSSLDLETETEETHFKGDSVLLTGSAFYNNNESAPAVYSPVTIRVQGPDLSISYFNTTTDEDGNFSRDMTLDIAGEFQINITVTNRTMAAYDDVSIMIIDITYLSQKLQMTTCPPDQKLWVNGTAKYSNQEPVKNSDIKIRINETLSWTGMTDTSGDYSVLITAPSDTGVYDVNVSVKNGSLEYYNETSITVSEESFPDLAIGIEDIVFISTYTPPAVDSEVNITVTVHNSGSAHCENVEVSFYLGDPTSENLLGTDEISQITAGDTGTSWMKWTAQNGTHDISIVLDPLNTIEESFEDNNEATKSIFVDMDFDGDGIGDIADFDDDNDNVDDEDDEFPYNSLEWLDTDSDGVGNNADLDDDDDGLLDTEEDKNQNGVRDAGETDSLLEDTDNDGKSDLVDYYPLDNKKWEKPKEEDPFLFLMIMLILVIVAVIVAVLVVWRSGRKPSEEIPPASEEPKEDETKPKDITKPKGETKQPPKKASPPPRKPAPKTPKPKTPKENKGKKTQPPPPP
jgi:hypothetical protein